jgi:hypothetical protein
MLQGPCRNVEQWLPCSSPALRSINHSHVANVALSKVNCRLSPSLLRGPIDCPLVGCQGGDVAYIHGQPRC